MRLTVTDPPREFTVGAAADVVLRDCMTVGLEPGESAVIANDNESAAWPVQCRRWGFAVPVPLNRPIGRAGLRAVIAGRDADSLHLLLVDPAKAGAFEDYTAREGMRVIARLSEGG